MQLPILLAHVHQWRFLLCRSAVRWPLVSSVLQLVCATAGKTVRNSIGRLVCEPCRGYAVVRQECSTSVWRHRSCHMQVSSVLQQYMVDDLLQVAIDIRLLYSHQKIVFEGRLFWDQCGTDPNFCWLPFGNSSEILVLWTQENRFVRNLSVYLGNLAVPIWPSPWGSCLVFRFRW